MAPTICSGKKRQTRTIATTDIRRHGQRSQLNQSLSNIVNYVAKGSMNPRVSSSMRIQTHNQQEKNTTGTTHHQHYNHHHHHSANNEASSNYKTNNNNHNNNHLTQTSATLAANHRRQQFPFVSDNAITSSTHSDTENSFDLRLTTNDTSTNDTFSSASSNMNPTSSMSSSTPSLSSSSQKATSSYHQQEDRRFQRYSSKVNGSADVTVSASNAEANKIHSKHFYHYDNDNDVEEVNDDGSSDSLYAGVSDTDSMTSLDTEKSAELKRGNHPLWRDKFLAKQQNNNRKSLTNVSNTEGLLSIAIKTINLVKRNQLLQQRLTQLQLETSDFIQSVLANPENRHFRDNMKQKVKEVENI